MSNRFAFALLMTAMLNPAIAVAAEQKPHVLTQADCGGYPVHVNNGGLGTCKIVLRDVEFVMPVEAIRVLPKGDEKSKEKE